MICEHLGLEPTNFTPVIGRTALEAKQKDGSLKEPQVIEPLSNLILDLEYLQEVRAISQFFFFEFR